MRRREGGIFGIRSTTGRTRGPPSREAEAEGSRSPGSAGGRGQDVPEADKKENELKLKAKCDMRI